MAKLRGTYCLNFFAVNDTQIKTSLCGDALGDSCRDQNAVFGQLDKLGWMNYTLHHTDVCSSIAPPFVFYVLERGDLSVSIRACIAQGKEPLGTYSRGAGRVQSLTLGSGGKHLAPAGTLTPTVLPVAGQLTDSRVSVPLMHTLYLLKYMWNRHRGVSYLFL
jgi:hypothetical protein